jgi:hypothetical protein
MRSDKSQSPARADIAGQPGQPGARAIGSAEDGSRIHSSGPAADYTDLMPEELPIHEPVPLDSTISSIIEGQHRNFDNKPYGTDAHPYSMDAVPRETWPTNDLGIEVLPAKFVGVDGDTPVVVANKPNQAMRNIPRPSTSQPGDR